METQASVGIVNLNSVIAAIEHQARMVTPSVLALRSIATDLRSLNVPGRRFSREDIIVTAHTAAESVVEMMIELKASFAEPIDYSAQQRAIARIAARIEKAFTATN